MPKLYLDYQTPDQSVRLWELVRHVQRDDPLTPVTIIGPSVYANLTLRRELGRSGFANVQFLVLSRLAELLGAPSLAAAGRVPMTRIVESAAVRATATQATGDLSNHQSHPSTHQSLRYTFRELRTASVSARDILSGRSGLLSEVIRLYRDFRRRTRTFYHEEHLAAEAAKTVRNGEVSGLDDLGFIVFYDLRDVSPAQQELIKALARSGRQSGGGCAALFGITGDDVADSPIRALAGQLSAELGTPSESGPPDATAHTELAIAPDPHQEIRWVIRRLALEAESGTSFRRMAVLYRKHTPYSTLISEELDLAGIPVAGPSQATLGDTAVGRALLGLMSIAEGDLSRDSVTAWFTSCPVRRPPQMPGAPGSHNRLFSPSRWDAISKEAGVVSGLEQWKNRLDVFADSTEGRADDAEDQGEISEARASRMRADADTARDLLSFIERLADDANRPEDGSHWSEFTSWANNLLDAYLIHPSDMPESEQTAREKIYAELSRLEEAQAIDPRPSFTSFRRALDEALSVPLGHLGTVGQGVFVAQFGAAAGMSFEVVHLVGMVEGAVPPALRDSPLIPERDRGRAGGAAAGLTMQRERIAKERYDFLTALASSRKRVLSYPVSDPSARRGQYPSRWYLEQASELTGRPVYTPDLPSLAAEDWLTITPSAQAALNTIQDSSPADLLDYDVERLWRWKSAGRDLRSHPLVHDSDLGRALALGRGRFGSRFTEWDGNLSGVVNNSRFARGLSQDVHSPTSLERWANCPFSYLLGSVLRIGSPESPEDVHTISALDRGLLIHEILERFIRTVIADKDIPAPDEPWTDDHRNMLREIASERFAEAESRGVTGKRLMWQQATEDILSDLDTFLEQDTQLRQRFGVSQQNVEARFGMPGTPWPEAVFDLDDGGRVRFRGVIDRVDVSPDGKTALVLDYKTGSKRPYTGLEDDPTDHGKRLQLGVYLRAAQRALAEEGVENVKSAYWFVTGRGGFELAPTLPASLSSTEERVREVLSTVMSGIKSGAFAASPGDTGWRGFENCTYCDFDSLCPSRRDVLWRRKSGDSLLRSYRHLIADETE